MRLFGWNLEELLNTGAWDFKSDSDENENENEESKSDGSSNDCDTSGSNEPINKSDDSDTDTEIVNYETRTNRYGRKNWWLEQ